MLRPGRLETLFYIGLPSPQERVSILKTMMKKVAVDSMLASLGERNECEGFSGADLWSWLRSAGQAAITRKSERIEGEDLMKALGSVTASVRDISHYEKLKEKLGMVKLGMR
jgi:ribosome biogenesis ATPase